MRFMVDYPVLSHEDGGAWLDPANIAEFARAAERCGVDGLAVTDHPAPSGKWLGHGGHETFDPFVALGFVAAATTSLRVMTYLTVIPYRNPFLSARSMMSVDVLSGGRATFALGTGYLRSEFAALGVDFDERNELFDEAVEVMREVWSGAEVRRRGRHFEALGVVMRPGPVQKPHPPLWLGGNATVVRRRVARWAQGWAPLLGDPTLLRTSRTRSIGDDLELAALIAEIKEDMATQGRDPSTLDVVAASATPLPADASPEQRLEALNRLAQMGVTWTSVPVRRGSFAQALEGLQRYGEEVIEPARHEARMPPRSA